jgi:hypothetical protein
MVQEKMKKKKKNTIQPFPPQNQHWIRTHDWILGLFNDAVLCTEAIGYNVEWCGKIIINGDGSWKYALNNMWYIEIEFEIEGK